MTTEDGLAASTLAQRFGTVEGLQSAAACAGWEEMSQALDAAGLSAAHDAAVIAADSPEPVEGRLASARDQQFL